MSTTSAAALVSTVAVGGGGSRNRVRPTGSRGTGTATGDQVGHSEWGGSQMTLSILLTVIVAEKIDEHQKLQHLVVSEGVPLAVAARGRQHLEIVRVDIAPRPQQIEPALHQPRERAGASADGPSAVAFARQRQQRSQATAGHAVRAE